MIWNWWHQSEAKKMKSRVNLSLFLFSHLSHSSPNFFVFLPPFQSELCVNFTECVSFFPTLLFFSQAHLLLPSSSSSSLIPLKTMSRLTNYFSPISLLLLFDSLDWRDWRKRSIEEKKERKRESSFQSRWWWDNSLIRWWMSSIQSMTMMITPSVIKQHN